MLEVYDLVIANEKFKLPMGFMAMEISASKENYSIKWVEAENTWYLPEWLNSCKVVGWCIGYVYWHYMPMPILVLCIRIPYGKHLPRMWKNAHIPIEKEENKP